MRDKNLTGLQKPTLFLDCKKGICLVKEVYKTEKLLYTKYTLYTGARMVLMTKKVRIHKTNKTS
jgi:hypothetical protein